MDENRLRFGVGVLVISAIAIGVILTFLFGAFPSILSQEYTLTFAIPSAEGISTNARVVRDGVAIGRVSAISLRDDGGVDVTLSMDSGRPISHTYVPRIGSGNFVSGDANIEFVKATPNQLTSIYNENEPILNQPWSDSEYYDLRDENLSSPSLLDMSGDLGTTFAQINQAGQSLALAGESIRDVAEKVGELVDGSEGGMTAVSDQAVQTLEEFQGAIRGIRNIVEDPDIQADLKASIDALPGLLVDAQKALSRTEETLDSIGRAGKQFEQVGVAAEETVNVAKRAVENTEKSLGNTVRNAEQTFANLDQFTKPLADRGDELVTQALTTLSRLDKTLKEVESFSRTLNNSNGSLKRFLEDDELYYQVRRTIENIEEATSRVRPILDDVRIFSDKIARDPRQLGVRGAITKRPNSMGLK